MTRAYVDATFAPAASPTLTGTVTIPSGTALAAPVFTSSPTGDGVQQWATLSVTTGQLKALRATPKTIVPAPGAGKIIEFISGTVFLDYGTTQYAEDAGGSNLAVRYTDGSGVQVSDDIEMTGFITQAGDYVTGVRKKVDAIVAKAGCENAALVLHNIGAGELVTGDSVIRIQVAYRVLSTSF
jgi:hypothetical protein